MFNIRCREEMVAMVQELKDKQERAQALTEEVSKLPRNINRSDHRLDPMSLRASSCRDV